MWKLTRISLPLKPLKDGKGLGGIPRRQDEAINHTKVVDIHHDDISEWSVDESGADIKVEIEE
jgi:hypothetical protein